MRAKFYHSIKIVFLRAFLHLGAGRISRLLTGLVLLCIIVSFSFPVGNVSKPSASEPQVRICQAYLDKQVDGEFKFSYVKHSAAANYYYFEQVYNSIPVFNCGYKVVVDKRDHLRKHVGQHIPAYRFAGLSSNFSLDSKATQITLPAKFYNWKLESSEKIIYQNENVILPAQRFMLYNEPNQARTQLVVGLDGAVLDENDLRSYVDSVAVGLVFQPDPLTTAMTDYGGSFIDDNDADNASLNGQRKSISIVATFEDDSFRLKNEFFEITELGDPLVPVVPELFPTFIYERSEDGFEQLMAYYHLNKFKSYLDSLGFDSLADEPLQVDVHAVFGSDNSFFLPTSMSGEASSLQFGEGGVDDAEDADVIIHEYAHAISYSASPSSNVGFERQALDEGFGDYLAVSYSRSFSEHNWAQVFNWDGHNPFWNGRRADWPWHYPEDLGISIYSAGQLWSSAMFDIWDVYGKTITDRLMIEAMYGTTPNISLQDGAQLILLADSLLYGGDHYTVLYDLLFARGLIEGEISGVEDSDRDRESALLNTMGFAQGKGPLIYDPKTPQDLNLKLIAMNGDVIWTQNFRAHQTVQVPCVQLDRGVYLLTVEIPDFSSAKTLEDSPTEVFKVQRF